MNSLSSLLARVMIVGTTISAALIAAGLVWYLSAHSGQRPGDHIFTGEPKFLTSPAGMAERAAESGASGERRSLAMVGIFLLLLNPPLRVLLAGAGYAVERNGKYTLISGIVFLVLAFSFFW